MIYRFHGVWQRLRVSAIAIFVLGSILEDVKIHSCEYGFKNVCPGLPEPCIDCGKREAFDRVKEGSTEEEDFHQATEYEIEMQL